MKVLFVLATLVLAGAAHADEACSLVAQTALETQARADFRDPSLVADPIDTSDLDGGSYLIKFASVRRLGAVIATYRVDIGETCQIMGVNIVTR